MINAIITQNYIYNKNKKTFQNELTTDVIEYFNKLNIFLIPLSNNLISKKKIENIFNKFDIRVVILSGGNDIPKNEKKTIRDIIELRLIESAIKKNIKILGICRGMQIINYYFEGKTSKLTNHVNVRHKIFPNIKFKKYLPTIVNSFHNFGITEDNLSKKMKIIASDKNKNIEAFVDNDFNILSFMWHPEREKKLQRDFYLIKKFLNA